MAPQGTEFFAGDITDSIVIFKTTNIDFLKFKQTLLKESKIVVVIKAINGMYMRDILKNILEKYPNARATTSFGGQHEIRALFERLKESISSLKFVKNNQNLLVKYSYGKGNWAQTPWIAILDERETMTTQKGTYVVILFRDDGDGCHLKLGQGVTEITEVDPENGTAV